MALRLSWKGICKGITGRLVLVLNGFLCSKRLLFNTCKFHIKDHPRYLEANAVCKHFDVHGGPENIPVSRFSFNAQVRTCS